MLNIVNYYEQLVIDELWMMAIKHTNDNLSHDDIEDIACLALNNLPASYVKSAFDKASHLSETDYQHTTDRVKHAINDAIKKIGKHPHMVREI